MARHSLAFPPLQPLETDILKEVFNTGRTSTTESEYDSSMTNDDPNPFPARNSIRSPVPALDPCDERLEELDMSFWTAVPIPSDLAAKIISLYLETDHPLLGAFDPDLFVNDMIKCRTEYCSHLLISAVMYWGCQMYSTLNSTVKHYVPQFCEEAEKRWTEEKWRDSLLTLAATQLLGLAYLGDGKDHYVLTYVSEVNSMGIRMGLFGVESSVVISKARELSPEMQSATSYAAWGVEHSRILTLLD
ncbi:hypothetical protein NW762_009886 [Fusarium torreyae]|uniref:Transcription factor domain-containing protein n=1 Tax=Fusarium torreyae TaxID=1237075 RepID=A0A9W8VDM5_9HYPO|nr:hypothetical protein NW762_009886 [Fusarium torreyae]